MHNDIPISIQKRMEKIFALPAVLQDLIYEYNVEHRPQMKSVLEELTIRTPYRLTCAG